MSDDGDGINQRVMDMGTAIAKLSADMEWVKVALADISKKLDKNDDELKKAMAAYQDKVDRRLEDHEERIERLEDFRAKVKGVAIALSALSSSAVVVYLITKLIGG